MSVKICYCSVQTMSWRSCG